MKTTRTIGLWLAPVAVALLFSITLLFGPALASSKVLARKVSSPVAAQTSPLGKQKDPSAAMDACGPDDKAPACKDLVEVEVKDVVPLTEVHAHAVVLVSKRDQTLLPIFVDEGSAVSIAFRLAHQKSPQPQSADLLEKAVEALGGKVTEVRIDSIKGDVFEGRVFIAQGEKQLSLAARPSDSIAMALGGGAKIRVPQKVLSKAGITQQEVAELRKQLKDHGQLPPGHPALPPGHGEGPGIGGSGPGTGGSGPGQGDDSDALPIPKEGHKPIRL